MSLISDYQIIIFDCDGVILNSNAIKTEAFYESILEYGEENATELVNYHKSKGGVSRYKKFDHFFQDILNIEGGYSKKKAKALDNFSYILKELILNCEVSEGLYDLYAHKADQKWMVASGSDEKELNEVLLEKKVSHFFLHYNQ